MKSSFFSLFVGVLTTTSRPTLLCHAFAITTSQKSITNPTVNLKQILRARTALHTSRFRLQNTSADQEFDHLPSSSSQKRRRVAIIGGGIAGLSCAAHLQSAYDITVYDTGRLRPGGRASSRQRNDPMKEDEENNKYPLLSQYRYDHAAQFITSQNNGSSQPSWRTDFDDQVQQWAEQGILKLVSNGSIYIFEKEGTLWKQKFEQTESTSSASVNYYYPTDGMSSLSQALIRQGSFKVEQDVWVSPSSGLRYKASALDERNSNNKASEDNTDKGVWNLKAQGRTLGSYSHLIIAHNGKCADRLMSQTPAKDVHKLLRVNFNDRVPANGGQRMTLNSLYSLTICVKSPSILSKTLPDNFMAGFIQQHPYLSMISCQTRKYPIESYVDNPAEKEEIEVWNILSSASFAKKHKAPQEFLPDDVIQNVTKLLMEAVEEDIVNRKSSDNMPGPLLDQILDSRLQLWGAAVPMNVWRANTGNTYSTDDQMGAGFIYDPKYQVGVCGDWLLEPSIAGAWTSGLRMAEHLINQKDASTSGEDYVGIQGHFEPSQGVRRLGIASLDGLVDRSQERDSNVVAKGTPQGLLPNKRNERKNPSQQQSRQNYPILK